MGHDAGTYSLVWEGALLHLPHLLIYPFRDILTSGLASRVSEVFFAQPLYEKRHNSNLRNTARAPCAAKYQKSWESYRAGDEGPNILRTCVQIQISSRSEFAEAGRLSRQHLRIFVPMSALKWSYFRHPSEPPREHEGGDSWCWTSRGANGYLPRTARLLRQCMQQSISSVYAMLPDALELPKISARTFSIPLSLQHHTSFMRIEEDKRHVLD